MLCNKCGKENENNAKFCANCGNKFVSREKNKKICNIILSASAIIIIFAIIFCINTLPQIMLKNTLEKNEWVQENNSSSIDIVLIFKDDDLSLKFEIPEDENFFEEFNFKSTFGYKYKIKDKNTIELSGEDNPNDYAEYSIELTNKDDSMILTVTPDIWGTGEKGIFYAR